MWYSLGVKSNGKESIFKLWTERRRFSAEKMEVSHDAKVAIDVMMCTAREPNEHQYN